MNAIEEMARAAHKKPGVSTKSSHAHPEAGDQPERQVLLDESSFIRSRLFDRDRSAFERYRELVFSDFTWLKLVRYELLVTFLGPLPGALGFVLRKRLYRSLFRSVGKGAIFGPNLILNHADRITLGEGVVIDRDCVLDARGAGEDGVKIGNRVIVNRGAAIQAKVGRIEIGDDCNIGSGVDIVAQGPIILGRNVSIAGKTMIAGGRYVVEQEEGSPGVKKRFSRGAIRIGNNARIGMGAIIQDGVTIGDNAIVAPGAVVYEDVAPDSVVWGNPAQPVRKRSSHKAPAMGSTQPAASGPTLDELRQRVCAYLENDLFVEFGPDGIGMDESLLDSAVMDSLALVRLLLWIEKQFDVDLDFAGLDPSQVDSVEKIVARIDERRK